MKEHHDCVSSAPPHAAIVGNGGMNDMNDTAVHMMCDKMAQLFNQKQIENEISPSLWCDFDLFANTALSAFSLFV